VIKADGLAGGKGVVIAESAGEGCTAVDAMMEERSLGAAGASVVIEEFLEGEEISVLALTDGQALAMLEPVVDHKQVGEGDQGPNTGGMGVFSPVPSCNHRLLRQIEQHILVPTMHGMRRDEIDYRGCLFAGLMLTDSGPRVLEYNCRFGDPELQALVRRMDSDLVPFLLAVANGSLSELEAPVFSERTCVGVVAASEGYPGPVRKGDPIDGLADAAALEDVVVFHAGTKAGAHGVATNGGRVLCVTALGRGLADARELAYRAYDRIQWQGKFCRRDIGTRGQRRSLPDLP
jgi:phosphoribosylamine--glycine ligase